MKSLMQEASSVIKAIEKGWESAGKPNEFSIKVFEEPKKNFIGMTIQSAKIGIFYDEKTPKKIEKEEFKKRESFPTKQVNPVQVKQSPEFSQEKNRKEFVKKEKIVEARPLVQEQKHHKEVWTEDMIQQVKNWLDSMLKQLHKSNITFSIQPSSYQLNIEFNGLINKSPEKDQQLMRSFALILMQTLRHSFKRPLRGFKIMLTTKNI